jgi:hypothetical protein
MMGTGAPRLRQPQQAMSGAPARQPLHETTNTPAAAVRIVHPTPPRRLGGDRDDVCSRAPWPTRHPSHILAPPEGKRRDDGHALHPEFQRPSRSPQATGPRGSTTHTTHRPPREGDAATGSPMARPKPVLKKRLHIHSDHKTFSLVPQDHPDTSPTLSASSLVSSSAHHAAPRSSSITSCASASSASTLPATPGVPARESKQPTSADPRPRPFVGGLRKVSATPDLNQDAGDEFDGQRAPVPEVDPPGEAIASSHHLSTKFSFQTDRTETDTITSEHTNFVVYRQPLAPNFDTAPSSESNYHTFPAGSSSPASVLQQAEFENYELLGDPSPSASYVNLRPSHQYSHDSLRVPALNPQPRRLNEILGYYKSRSRESLRTGSLTSISTVLSQQEAPRAIVGSGSLIRLPAFPSILKGTSSWARPLASHPLRTPMNETPHQWSSQLSTVPSVSEGGTDRGSRSFSDNGRRSSFFQSSHGRHSRQMLSISSSLAAEDATRSMSDSLESPEAAFTRNGQFYSGSSVRIIGAQDEYGDGITEMPNLRTFPSRSGLSGFYSISDNGRTNTMLSSSSSRANSLLASTIPTWARLYYGSGERRFLGVGAPGSSSDGSDSRASSFRSGSPNTDHLPLSIYSPRRRPREINAHARYSNRGSMEITPAPQLGSDGRLIRGRNARGFRTWSMSSVWSPHLQRDKRATRHSIWGAPSLTWSTEGGWFGRRNVQIVMFIFGFVLPFGKLALTDLS